MMIESGAVRAVLPARLQGRDAPVERVAMDDTQFWAELDGFLGRWRTASLATVDDCGSPHGANVWYAHDVRLRLVFASSADSAHLRHIQARPRAAVTICAETADPLAICGIQMHGRCAVLGMQAAAAGEDGLPAAWRLYFSKYPFAEREPFRSVLAGQRLVRFAPDWVRWIDNRRGFGFRMEREISSGR